MTSEVKGEGGSRDQRGVMFRHLRSGSREPEILLLFATISVFDSLYLVTMPLEVSKDATLRFDKSNLAFPIAKFELGSEVVLCRGTTGSEGGDIERRPWFEELFSGAWLRILHWDASDASDAVTFIGVSNCSLKFQQLSKSSFVYRSCS